LSREIDALVAEHVMGEKRHVRMRGSHEVVPIYTTNPFFSDGTVTPIHLVHYCQPRHYSSDIGCAWLIVLKMLEKGYHFVLDGPPGYFCGFDRINPDDDTGGEANADTAPMAICIAALKAHGVTPDQQPNGTRNGLEAS
jgi:hypothetical protein